MLSGLTSHSRPPLSGRSWIRPPTVPVTTPMLSLLTDCDCRLSGAEDIRQALGDGVVTIGLVKGMGVVDAPLHGGKTGCPLRLRQDIGETDGRHERTAQFHEANGVALVSSHRVGSRGLKQTRRGGTKRSGESMKRLDSYAASLFGLSYDPQRKTCLLGELFLTQAGSTPEVTNVLVWWHAITSVSA
jgi:hypothetical protein